MKVGKHTTLVRPNVPNALRVKKRLSKEYRDSPGARIVQQAIAVNVPKGAPHVSISKAKELWTTQGNPGVLARLIARTPAGAERRRLVKICERETGLKWNAATRQLQKR